MKCLVRCGGLGDRRGSVCFVSDGYSALEPRACVILRLGCPPCRGVSCPGCAAVRHTGSAKQSTAQPAEDNTSTLPVMAGAPNCPPAPRCASPRLAMQRHATRCSRDQGGITWFQYTAMWINKKIRLNLNVFFLFAMIV